jgi:hypothetical protein
MGAKDARMINVDYSAIGVVGIAERCRLYRESHSIFLIRS